MKTAPIMSMVAAVIATASYADQNSEISAYSTAKSIIEKVGGEGYPALSLSNNTLRFIPPEISSLPHLLELKIGNLEDNVSETQGLAPISLKPIEDLVNLKILEVFRPVKDIDVLASATQLETLRLWPGFYDYCASIGSLPNLSVMTIQLEDDASLGCLSGMEILERAHFRMTDCRNFDIAGVVNSSANLVSIFCDASPAKIVEPLATQWKTELETIFEITHRPPSNFIEMVRK